MARAAALAVAVVGLDLGTKALVEANVGRGSRDGIFPGVELVNVRNPGIAFGLLGGGGVLLTVLTIGAIVLLLAYFVGHSDRPLLWLPTGLLVGGAAGNLLDRIGDRAVTDFLDLPLWPAFNVADVAITVGVLSLLYVLEAAPGDARD
jgi:signal peptidase II